MTGVVIAWVLWFGNGNGQVTVSGIASERACHELAAGMQQSEFFKQRYVCLSYAAAVGTPEKSP